MAKGNRHAPEPAPAVPPAAAGARLWIFRGLAAVVLPLALAAGLELALRIAGYGYPAPFLIPVAGRDHVRTPNPRFGWRFFPRHLARGPVPFELEAGAGPDRRFRIFVAGGSAARGTPDSAYSFGRILEVLLRESFPATRFEVHNAAMTAINSHVVLPIVRDCARYRPDLFVIYLGNNEVVGPHGAATVFRPFSSSVTAIRAANAVRALRLGQLLDRAAAAAGRAVAGGDPGPREWRGMEMFLERRVAFGDPRLETVYRHLRRNLDDLLEAAGRAGARTLLATVAVNLRDQPPFASSHRPDLTPGELSRWQKLYRAGNEAFEKRRFEDAEASFASAAAIDDLHADLHYRRGRARALLGRGGEARESFRRARDLDTLRFRADSRIQQILREVAADGKAAGVLFADAEAGADRASAGGVPGHELFYEHVHLTFAGNYTVAETIFEVLAADGALAARFGPRREGPLPGPDAVRDQLVLSPFDAYDLEQEMLAITSRPPFTGIDGYSERVDDLRRRLRRARSQLTAELWRSYEERYRARLAAVPGDLELRRRFATRLQARGQAAEAAGEWRALLARLPGVTPWRNALALALADSGEARAAIAELEAILRAEPGAVEALLNLGAVHQRAGDPRAAMARFREVLEIVPGHAEASFNLGTALLESGAVDAALAHLRKLVGERPELAAAHHNLGHALERQGDLEGAIVSYRRAIAAEPAKANAHNSLGLALETAGRLGEAVEAFREALHHEPDLALAHFNLADLWLAQGRAAEAAEHYEQGLRYRPGNAQARYNLAGALQMLGDTRRAAGEFRRVLEARGEDPGALNNLAWILATSADPELRDRRAAVDLAERAARATGHRAPEILDTLATAYAFAGRLDDATSTLESALEIAREQGDAPLARALDRRLAALRQAR